MASKKYRTLQDALTLPAGKTIADLDKKDLQERLATVVPVTWKRKANLAKAGLENVSTAELPDTKYGGKNRSELAHIFAQNKLWLERRDSSTVRGARRIAERTMTNLGFDKKAYKTMDKNLIGKMFEEFHKLQELRPDWFIGKYSEDYLRTIAQELATTGKKDIMDIIDKLTEVRRKEQDYNAKVYGDEDIGDIFLR